MYYGLLTSGKIVIRSQLKNGENKESAEKALMELAKERNWEPIGVFQEGEIDEKYKEMCFKKERERKQWRMPQYEEVKYFAKQKRANLSIRDLQERFHLTKTEVIPFVQQLENEKMEISKYKVGVV